MSVGSERVRDLRYRVMLALYLPILLYAFSTYDFGEEMVAAREVSPVLVEGPETVLLGQDYNARAYLTATQLAEGARIRLDTDKRLVQIQDSSRLRIPSTSLLNEGEEEATFGYSVTMQYEAIGDTTFHRVLRDSFTVRRPTLVATQTSARSLYRQTLNQVRIDVPGLANRPLRLRTSTRSVKGRQISLSPSESATSVRAYLVNPGGKDTYLGSKEFNVIDPPKPQIEVRDARGELLTNGGTISRSRPLLQFEAVSDREFKRSHPQDAHYRIRSARVSIKKGIQPSREIGTFDLEDGTLNLVRSLQQVDARRKDQVLIQLQEVVRINHAGEAIPVELNEASVSYIFTLS